MIWLQMCPHMVPYTGVRGCWQLSQLQLSDSLSQTYSDFNATSISVVTLLYSTF